MTIWIYTEDENPVMDGPFFSEFDASQSVLWEWLGACVWMEYRSCGGNTYENVKFLESGWTVTSSGVIPIEPFKPEFLLRARYVGGGDLQAA